MVSFGLFLRATSQADMPGCPFGSIKAKGIQGTSALLCTLMISPLMVRNIIAEGVAVSSYTNRELFSEKYKITK